MLEADDTFVFGCGHQQRRSHVLLERRMPPPSVRTITHAESTHNKQSTECDFPPLSYQSRTSKTREVISMMFHPELDILIAIWSDGVLRSWNAPTGLAKEPRIRYGWLNYNLSANWFVRLESLELGRFSCLMV